MADASFANVVLLLTFDREGSGNRYFFDHSPVKNIISSTITDILTTAQKKFSYATSARFNGGWNSGAGIVVSAPDSAAFNFASSDFTIEFYFSSDSVPTVDTVIIEKFLTYGILVGINATGKLYGKFQGSTSGSKVVTDTAAISANTWTHCALVKSGTSIFIYRNGTKMATTTGVTGALNTNTHLFSIGQDGNVGSGGFTGYLQDLRVTKGVARYTGASFTVPTNLYAEIPAPVAYTPKLIDARFSHNMRYLNSNYGGAGTLTGTVKVGSTTVQRKVRLYDETTGLLIEEKWANADGTYSFPDLRTDLPFTVIAVDHLQAYNNVIAARVLAV